MTLQNHDAIPDFSGGFVLTESDFDAISTLALDWYGLSLTPSKKQLVYGRLAKRLRALKLTEFQSYLKVLQQNDNAAERQEFLSALTTNVTHFFRESHHFDLLAESVLPSLVESAKNGGRVRIWSAGCSSGQEPYSIALSLLKICPQAPQLDIKILATDIDPKILQDGRAAVYPIDELEAIPSDLQDNPTWINRLNAKQFRIGAEACSLVSFAELNLIGDWPMRGKFDLIFCRNVAIYFDMETQSKLWKRFSEILTDTAHLIIGHSERLSGPATNEFKSVGITSYKKCEQKTAKLAQEPLILTSKGELK